MTFSEFGKIELILFLVNIIFFIIGFAFHAFNEHIKSSSSYGYKYTIRMMAYRISDFFIRLWWFINVVIIIIAIFYLLYFCVTSIFSIW